jgi:hypothetical protein
VGAICATNRYEFTLIVNVYGLKVSVEVPVPRRGREAISVVEELDVFFAIIALPELCPVSVIVESWVVL